MSQWTKVRIAPERLQSWVQFIISFHIKKPQGGTETQASSYRSVCSNQQVVKKKKWLIVPAISPGHSISGGKWSHTWHIGCASGALGKSLNKSINHCLIFGLFYLTLLQEELHTFPSVGKLRWYSEHISGYIWSTRTGPRGRRKANLPNNK